MTDAPVPFPASPGPGRPGLTASGLRRLGRLAVGRRRLRGLASAPPTTPRPWRRRPLAGPPGHEGRRAQRPVRHRRLRARHRRRPRPARRGPAGRHGAGDQRPAGQARAAYTAPGFGTLTSAGGTAKAVVLAEAVGADPRRTAARTWSPSSRRPSPTAAPRRAGSRTCSTPSRPTPPTTRTSSARRTPSRRSPRRQPGGGRGHTFLLAQQCRGGWFRLGFTQDAKSADQSCDADTASKPDLDATAFAVQALTTTTRRRPPRRSTRAVAWLKEQQAQDGSFGGGATGTPNTNSTGLAGTALAGADDTAAAEQAATWVFGHQVLDCQKFDPPSSGPSPTTTRASRPPRRRGSPSRPRTSSAGPAPARCRCCGAPGERGRGPAAGSC